MDDLRCKSRAAGLSPSLTNCQHAKKNIYGAAMKKWSSFSVHGATEIVHEASHPMSHDRKPT